MDAQLREIPDVSIVLKALFSKYVNHIITGTENVSSH